MTTEAQRRAMKRYHEKNKKTKKQVLLVLDREREADVIGKLESVPNKKNYIVGLIREDT